MARKPLSLLSFTIAAIASAFMIDGYSAPSVRAQKAGAEVVSPSVTSSPTAIGQKSYPTVASDDWLHPRAYGKPFNIPVLVDNKGGKQHLALISQDDLNPPQSQCTLANLKDCGISINKPGREVRLVTQWRQNELLAWAYERSEVDNTPPKLPEPPRSSPPIGNPPVWSNTATIVRYTPLPEINEGLHRNLSWEAQCGSTSCLFKPLPPVPPTPPVVEMPCPMRVEFVEKTLPDGGSRVERIFVEDPSCVKKGSSGVESRTPAPKPPVIPRITVYVGSQQFQLDGKEGIFPISVSLAKALREAKSSAVKIITPRKWEATINPDAVRNLSVIYQEPRSSQMPR